MISSTNQINHIEPHKFSYDNEIFQFFQELDYFYEEPETTLKTATIEQIKFYLKTKSYSSIDMTDHKGNTLLHYACQYQDNDWIFYLLEEKANPYIKNNQDKTCFSLLDMDSQYYIFDRYLKHSYTPRDFIDSTKHLGQDFKESLLTHSKLSFHSIEETVSFLQHIQVENPYYFIYFIGKNALLATEDKLDYYLSQSQFEQTPENNSLFLSFITSSYRFNHNSEHIFYSVQQFSQLKFENNIHLSNGIYSLFSFFNKMNKNTDEENYANSVLFIETLMQAFAQHKENLPQDCLYMINQSPFGQYLILKEELKEKNGEKYSPHKIKI